MPIRAHVKRAQNLWIIKTAEVASKVADQKLNDKETANGENVYVDGHNRYYWIDKKGHKHYVKESSLRTKTK